MDGSSDLTGGDLWIPAALPLPQEASQGRSAPAGHPALEAAMLRFLLQLDPAVARWNRDQDRRAMLTRLWRGISAHFRLRATEWFCALILLQLGWILYVPPPAFPLSESWRVMATMMSEQAWGAIFLGIGAARFGALVVNGTFRRFRWSPHIRFVTAFLACGLWLQVVMSIYESAPNGTGYGIYRLILVLELYNLWRTCVDIGIAMKRPDGDA